MANKTLEKAIVIQKEKTEDIIDLPEIVELYFERADKPGKKVSIKVPITELFENVVKEAAVKLKFKNTRVGVLGGGMPISFAGKTVGEVIREVSSVSFQIASAEMLG